MSSQRGNVSRNRRQKYQNTKAFKNDLHDTSGKTKMINSLSHEGLCQPCKEKIEWKIKYKKYKPLSQPASCIRCHNKNVKRAYHTVCQQCAEKAGGVCRKCNQKREIVLAVQPSDQERLEEEAMNRFELMELPERKRRSILRFMEKGEGANAALQNYQKDEDEEFDECLDSDECDNDDNEDADIEEETKGMSQVNCLDVNT